MSLGLQYKCIGVSSAYLTLTFDLRLAIFTYLWTGHVHHSIKATSKNANINMQKLSIRTTREAELIK